MSPSAGLPQELEVRAWSPGDAPVLARAGLRTPTLWPRDEAEWDWAFRRNPAGTRLQLALAHGRVVALYAGLPVRTRFLGETRSFAQVLEAGPGPGDTEADREAWLAAARGFHQTYLGPEGELVLYGWPAACDGKLGRTHLELERLRVQSLLVRPCGPGTSDLPADVRVLERFGPEASELYRCCATHWNASAVRDEAFLNWRFADNRRHRYRMLGLQSGDTLRGYTLRGYAVERLANELAAGLALLVDWLVLPGDEEAAEALLAAALAGARADGATALATSLPEWSPWSLWFQERGFLHHPSEHVQVVLGAVPRYDMLWLRDNWWTTPCDALEL